jgi:hypothetical protein
LVRNRQAGNFVTASSGTPIREDASLLHGAVTSFLTGESIDVDILLPSDDLGRMSARETETGLLVLGDEQPTEYRVTSYRRIPLQGTEIEIHIGTWLGEDAEAEFVAVDDLAPALILGAVGAGVCLSAIVIAELTNRCQERMSAVATQCVAQGSSVDYRSEVVFRLQGWPPKIECGMKCLARCISREGAITIHREDELLGA